MPNGWGFAESGTNANTTYTAGTGSSTAGDTYSFGATGNTERAFGGLQSGTLIPTVGGCFINNTGQTITSLDISYTGEQWRLGATGRNDRLDFQYSTNATSLTTGTYTDFDALDFVAPISMGATGALDGNAAANRVNVPATISGLNIANGATLFIRWNSFDATGADDGLAVDDFSLTPRGTPVGSNVSGTKTVAGTFATGTNVTYTVVLTNTGAGVQMDGFGNEFEDLLPAGLTLVSANAPSGTINANLATNTVTWNGMLAANNGSVTITIVATINSGANGQVISNQGVITYDADADSDHVNEARRLTDDPGVAGTQDPTEFVVACSTAVTPPVTITLSSNAGTANTPGVCTLRVALTAARTQTVTGGCPAGGSTTTIVVPLVLMSTTVTLTERDNTEYGFNGLPIVGSNVTIQGNGLTITRGAEPFPFRFFYVSPCGNLTLQDVTLTNGLAQGGAGGTANEGGTGGGGAGLGGAVLNRGTLKIIDCMGMVSYSLTIGCPAVTLAPTTLPGGMYNVAYASQTLTASGTGLTGAFTFALQTGSLLPPGLMLSSAGVISGTPTQPGAFTFTVIATHTASGCTGNRTYTIGIQCPAINIAPATLPNPVVGAAYNQSLTGSGGVGPYTFALANGSSLPAGLTLTSAGVISGTPTQTGAATFTINITDTALAAGQTNCAGNRTYTITVVCPTITLSPTTLPNGTAGTAYNQTVSATPAGTTYNFAVTAGTLPAGLSLNSTTGAITGTPTAPGNSTFTITATGFGTCTGTQQYTVTIACPTITLTPTTLPAGTAGTAYNQTLTAAPAGGNYTFAVTTGALPAGLALNANGALSGTPTVTGTFTFTVTATGFGTCTGAQAYTLTLICPTITVTATPRTRARPTGKTRASR